MKLHVLLTFFLFLSTAVSSQEESNNKIEQFGQHFMAALIAEDFDAFKELTITKEKVIKTINEKSPKEVAEQIIPKIEAEKDGHFWEKQKKRLKFLFAEKQKIKDELIYIKTDFMVDERDSKQVGFDVGYAKVWFYIKGEKGIHYVHVDKMFESVDGWMCNEIGMFKTPGQSPMVPFLEDKATQPTDATEDAETEEVEEEAEEEVEMD